jgi:hypothetical protein
LMIFLTVVPQSAPYPFGEEGRLCRYRYSSGLLVSA